MARSHTTPKTRAEKDNGRVIEYRYSYYWVPESVKDMELRRGDKLELKGDGEENVEIDEFDSQKKAELWGQLQKLGESYEEKPIEYPSGPTPAHAREADIPLRIATEGKAKIAAYLFAVGYSELSLANGLDVSERTVGQYLSDVRRGER